MRGIVALNRCVFLCVDIKVWGVQLRCWSWLKEDEGRKNSWKLWWSCVTLRENHKARLVDTILIFTCVCVWCWESSEFTCIYWFYRPTWQDAWRPKEMGSCTRMEEIAFWKLALNVQILYKYCCNIFQGGDLDFKIQEYKDSGKMFTQSQVIDWFIQLLLGVNYMHERYSHLIWSIQLGRGVNGLTD